MRIVARHKRVHLVALLVLLFSLLPSGGVMPQAVAAEGRAFDTPQAPGADTGKEIVYIDNNGFIRVLDSYFTEKQVQWVSPTGGWRSAALGDFDGDGDMEIVAIRGTVGGDPPPELTIFDPVVATGAPDPGKEINGIPWKQLFTTPLPGRPVLVFAGNFDPNVPGDEIGISRQIVASDGANSDDKTRVVIYKQTSLTPTGTSWTEHARRDFSQEWDRVAVGNLDNAGADEVGFVDQDKGEFNFYRPDAALAKVDGPGGSSRNPMRDIAVGQYIGGGNREVLVARKESSSAQNTFEVYAYNGSLNAVTGNRLSPGPRVIAAGDINGSGDDEAIMVRYCTGDCVRLIVRNDGGDGVIQEFLDGLPLDTDDGFRAVAAGDIDGDGRDEIIIMRDTRIRWFPDAHNSARFLDENVRTNGRTLVVGDLDRNGFISGPVIEATPAQVTEIAYFGFIKTGTIDLQNVATNDAINYVALTNQPWLSVTPTAGLMPGRDSGKLRLTYRIDPTSLQVGGTFNANIAVTSSAPNVVNSPYTIPMTVTVQFPPFGTSPESATAFYYPCEEPLAEQTLTMNVVGVPGTVFTAYVPPPIVAAQIAESLQGSYYLVEQSEDGMMLTDRTGAQLAVPTLPTVEVQPSAVMSNTWVSQTPWITAAWSNSNSVPTQMSLTISPTLRTADFAQSTLILAGSSPLNPGQIIAGSTPIRLACASQASWLPLIGR